MAAVLSFSTCPVPGFLAMVSQRDYPQLAPVRVVDDAEVEKRLPAQFRVCLGTYRGYHLIAARARAIASAAGINLERPPSISTMRRSTSTAQASSTS